ncbi:uncharacterized protein UV8b_03398 [Ustilaginoidea virens]|uniref:Peptidase S8/S53 domain-containing protein n=1 Tax=Ustilaginoidea virens TaxID=1159556 RepID=A0A8E5MGQ1_USTVR|nr:uncharacterized protein UV8b_03398 [Ustilaginoidea virens]QUC19157.1 hypothetical protein UV8b_03398 [Ustilaginoidea virens]
MSSGPSTGSAGVELVPDSYIVTLQPKLGRASYEKHFEDVYTACRGVLASDGAPAHVEMVYADPIDGPEPQAVMYFAHFPASLAQVIGGRRDVADLHQEHLGLLRVAGTAPLRGYNWGTSRISQTDAVFQTEWTNGANGVSGPPPEPEHFVHNALASRGGGATVYVLDGGCDPTRFNVQGEFSAANLRRFIDLDAFHAHLRAIGATGIAPWLPWHWCKDWKQERLEAAEGHTEADTASFHGTNVSLCVGSSKRGTAPEARVVAMRIINAKAQTCAEKLIISALQIILDLKSLEADDRPSVVNCSWGMSFASSQAQAAKKAMTDMFDKVNKLGVPIVVASGNDHQILTLDNTEHPSTHSRISLSVPECLTYAYLVGGSDSKNKKWFDGPGDGSNYVDPTMPNQYKPKNPFIWAPGKDIPGCVIENGCWKLKTGTSFAAPLVSGAMACLLAHEKAQMAQDPQHQARTLDQLLQTVLRKKQVDGVDQDFLAWDEH